MSPEGQRYPPGASERIKVSERIKKAPFGGAFIWGQYVLFMLGFLVVLAVEQSVDGFSEDEVLILKE
jgi:hypothetical protein